MAVAVAVIALWPAPSQAWNDDVHYYLTYYLARQAGFDAATARLIAGTDLYTDYHPWTEAGVNITFFSQEQKRFWHFPKYAAYVGPDTTRNSFYAQLNLYNAMDGCDLVAFGMALHVYQDSWSHEDYGFYVGHAVDGHYPDMPYRHPEKAYEMAGRTLDVLKRLYSIRNGGAASPAPPIEQMKEFLDKVFKYNPNGYWDTLKAESIGHPKLFAETLDKICTNWMTEWPYKDDPDVKWDIKKYEAQYKDLFEQRIGFFALPVDSKIATLDFDRLDGCRGNDLPSVQTVAAQGDAGRRALALDEYDDILAEGRSVPDLIDLLIGKGEVFRLRDPRVRDYVSTVEGGRKVMEYAARYPDLVVQIFYHYLWLDPDEMSAAVVPFLKSTDRTVQTVAAILLRNGYEVEEAKTILGRVAGSAGRHASDPTSIAAWGVPRIR